MPPRPPDTHRPTRASVAVAGAGGLRLHDTRSKVRPVGLDQAFRRMREIRLAYCEAGFATSHLGVAPIRLACRES